MSEVIDKRCPVCGCYIKLHIGDVHSCISCPFACFEEDFDRVCKAMNAQAELAALNDAARQVARWWRTVDSQGRDEVCTVIYHDDLNRLDALAAQRGQCGGSENAAIHSRG